MCAVRTPSPWQPYSRATVCLAETPVHLTYGTVQRVVRHFAVFALTRVHSMGTVRLVPRSRTQQDSGRWCTSSRRRGTEEGRQAARWPTRRQVLDGGKPERALRKGRGNPVRVGDLWARFLGTSLLSGAPPSRRLPRLLVLRPRAGRRFAQREIPRPRPRPRERPEPPFLRAHRR